MSIGDSKENSFLDKDGNWQGKVYNYRIQAWGDHGPLEWVYVHGCHRSSTPVSDEHCVVEALMNSPGTRTQVEGFSEGRGISTVALHKMEIVTERSAGWWWMYSVNGFSLILGIIARQSLFFRIILAFWILFRDKVLGSIDKKLIKAQCSEYILWRIIAHSFLTFFSLSLFMQAKIWDLSRQVNGTYLETFSVNPHSPYGRENVAEIKNCNDINEFSGTDRSIEDSMIGASRDEDSFPSKFLSEKQGNALNLEIMQSAKASLEQQKQNIDGSMNIFSLDTEFKDAGEIETFMEKKPDARGECMKGTKRIMAMGTVGAGRHSSFAGLGSKDFQKRGLSAPNEWVDKCTENPVKTISLGDQRRVELSHVSGRKRCNYEGCKSQFDHWHSLSDWEMKFRKHYCRDCQGVFCVKHTRISPHGPFGQCNLESSCVCQACFESLPSEAQESLERINKLRVGPYASGDSISHQKNRKCSCLKNASSHTKINKFDLSGKNGTREAQNEHCSHRIGRDPYPQNLDLAYSSDSSDNSLPNLSQVSCVLSSQSHKVDSRLFEDGRISSTTSSQKHHSGS